MNKSITKRNFNEVNQYKGLKQLQRTLDNFFNDLWWPTTGLSEAWGGFQPSSALTEDKDNYYVEVDLPGIKKEEIKIEVEENILRVHGERKENKKQETRKCQTTLFGNVLWFSHARIRFTGDGRKRKH